MSHPRPTLPYSDEPGEKRRAPDGTVYEVVARMTRRDGLLGWLRLRPERLVEAAEWALWGAP